MIVFERELLQVLQTRMEMANLAALFTFWLAHLHGWYTSDIKMLA